jgi:hypothetical protein
LEKEKVDLKEVQGIDKYKTVTLSNGVRISTKDGKKVNFNSLTLQNHQLD